MKCNRFFQLPKRNRRVIAGLLCACLFGSGSIIGAEPKEPKLLLRPASIRPVPGGADESSNGLEMKSRDHGVRMAVSSEEDSKSTVGNVEATARQAMLLPPRSPQDAVIPVDPPQNIATLALPGADRTETKVTRRAGPAIQTISDELPTPPQNLQLIEEVRVAQAQPRPNLPPPAQPAPNAQPPVQPRPAVLGARPVDLTHPFETIGETGEISLMVRRSKLMRTQVDIYRTAVVDASIVEIVQFTPREISLIGKSTGTTHVTFWFDQPGSRPVTYLVRVEPDVERVKEVEDQYRLLEDVINEMYPDSKIELLVVADKLIIRGQAKDGEEAGQIISLIRAQSGGRGAGGSGLGGFGGAGGGLGEGTAADVLSDSVTGSSTRSRLQVINMLRVPGIQQVAMRVKIAELNRTAAKGFGVQVQGAINTGGSSQILLNSLVNAAGGAGPAIIAQFDGDDIAVGIKYLQQSGVVKLLSEPTLVTMSGRPATFLAGGEFAVPTLVGGAGINAVTTDFRSYGAVISFLPTVLDKDRIRLQVSPEFSQIDAGTTVNGTPGLQTRSATTTVEMREGQTLAIAGLISQSMSANKRGDLPFVSWLFGDRSVTTAETELIMLVTPELVQPMDPEEVPPLPGFDVTEPTNAQFFLQGRLEGNPNYDYRSTVWPRLRKRYGAGGSAMVSGPFGHGQ